MVSKAAIKIDERKLGDPGKLLLLLSSAAFESVEVQERLIDSYVFLLNQRRILEFFYIFRFEPFPYSGLLHDDLFSLIRAEYIAISSPLCISRKGDKWIESRLHLPHLEKARTIIGGFIKELSFLSNEQLYRRIYAEITRPIS